MNALKISSIGMVLAVTASAWLGACSSSDSGGGTGGSSGTGGSTGTGGSSSGSLINGCDPATAADHTGDANVDVTFPNGGITYAPPCIKIKAGSTVTWKGDFSKHPLLAGTVKGLTAPVPDDNSPITDASGMVKVVTFDAAGTFPYYCMYHYV